MSPKIDRSVFGSYNGGDQIEIKSESLQITEEPHSRNPKQSLGAAVTFGWSHWNLAETGEREAGKRRRMGARLPRREKRSPERTSGVK